MNTETGLPRTPKFKNHPDVIRKLMPCSIHWKMNIVRHLLIKTIRYAENITGAAEFLQREGFSFVITDKVVEDEEGLQHVEIETDGGLSGPEATRLLNMNDEVRSKSSIAPSVIPFLINSFG